MSSYLVSQYECRVAFERVFLNRFRPFNNLNAIDCALPLLVLEVRPDVLQAVEVLKRNVVHGTVVPEDVEALRTYQAHLGFGLQGDPHKWKDKSSGQLSLLRERQRERETERETEKEFSFLSYYLVDVERDSRPNERSNVVFLAHVVNDEVALGPGRRALTL